MSLSKEYTEYKSKNISLRELSGVYQFVIDLAKTQFRWFEVDMGGFPYLVEIQPCGTLWKTILLHRNKTQVTLEHLSQITIVYGSPITEDRFKNALEQAIHQLKQCNFNAAQ
jgi:hypothetical protein